MSHMQCDKACFCRKWADRTQCIASNSTRHMCQNML